MKHLLYLSLYTHYPPLLLSLRIPHRFILHHLLLNQQLELIIRVQTVLLVHLVLEVLFTVYTLNSPSTFFEVFAVVA